MTRLVALPYLQTSAVETGDWLVRLRGETRQVPDVLKGWDYQTALHFESKLVLDLDRVRHDCGLGRDAGIVALPTWWASSTNRRQAGTPVPLIENGAVSLQLDIPPGQAGGRLTLDRLLVLRTPGAPLNPLAATSAYSVLWREERDRRTTVIVEGDAARFPTQVIDFGAGRFADPQAAWWLDLDPSDMDTTPLTAMRLYLNAANPTVERLASGRDDEVTRLVSSVLTWDVVRTLVEAALESEDFIDGWGGFRPGSLGETLERLIQRYFAGEDARSVAAFRARNRGLFEARLQARVGMLLEAR